MYEQEEQLLQELATQVQPTELPENLDNYIKQGIQIARKQKRAQQKQRISILIAAVVLVLFVGSVRFSPSVGAFVKRLPGLGYIVEMIQGDTGLIDAVDNNLVQRLNLTDEHEGIKLTIKDMICDNSKIILFYTLEGTSNHRVVEFSRFTFTDEHGKALQAGYSWGFLGENDLKNTHSFTDQFEINLPYLTKLPNKLIATIQVQESLPYDELKKLDDISSDLKRKYSKILRSKWKFIIPVDTKKFALMKTTLQIDKTVEVDGQKITFQQLLLTPTLAMLDITYDNKNTKKILGFDQLSLVDENGQTWGTISNGVSGTIIDENHERKFFQSNYFRNPKALYISFHGIRAIDKTDSVVEIDMKNGTLLKGPSTMKLKEFTPIGSKLKLVFTSPIGEDPNYYYLFFSDVFDSKGKQVEKSEYGTSKIQENPSSSNKTGTFLIENQLTINNYRKINGNLKLLICDYPAHIVKTTKIQIK